MGVLQRPLWHIAMPRAGAVHSISFVDAEFAVYGEDPRIICRIQWGLARCLLGYPETGLRVLGEGVARARARNNPHAIAWSLVFLAHIQTYLRDAAETERAAAEVIAIAREHRFPQWLARAQERRGWALCQLGDAVQGLALLEEGQRGLHATG